MAWVDTGVSSDHSGDSVSVSVGAKHVLLVKTGARWLAVEDRCSHAACAFSSDGEVDGLVVVCNCHGSEFDLRTGMVMAPPADTPILTYQVRNVGGNVEIEM